MIAPISAKHFAVFRIILGVYLIQHFAFLIPYAQEIWSNTGVFPSPSLNFTHGVFPNVLNYCDSTEFIIAFLIALLLFSVLFTLGFYRRLAALFIWYGWVCLFDRNNLISNPGIPFVGWLLLCCTMIPGGECYSLKPKAKSDWEFPRVLWIGAWFVMSLSYTISGIDKLQSPSWLNGSAILHLVNNPLARDWWLRETVAELPVWIIKLMTYSILTIEVLFAPFALLRITRKWIWLAAVLMHVGILLLVDFADLTAGMLMIHIITFDVNWFPRVHQFIRDRFMNRFSLFR
jgi:uncharacterized membrane protein